jgi:uncharacterized Ntn-hydrolase superfamily protein
MKIKRRRSWSKNHNDEALMRKKPLVALVATLAALMACGAEPEPATPASALHTNTWSIVAANPETDEVGVALATCLAADVSLSHSNTGPLHAYHIVGAVGGGLEFELARLVPAFGVMVAQARVDAGNTHRIDAAFARILDEIPPEGAIAASLDGDPMSSRRQYAIATYDSEPTTFTGTDTLQWSGAVSDQAVAVQGNTLVDEEVVAQALSAFGAAMSDPDASLAEALLVGMEAGAAEGGDRRCPSEQAALTAFMAVAHRSDVGETPRIWLATKPQAIGGQNPVALLREDYSRFYSIPTVGGHRVVWWATGVVTTIVVVVGLWVAFRRA